MAQHRFACRVFLVVEALGALALAISGAFQSAVGPFLWATGYVLLMPGIVLVGPLVEHALWRGGLELRTIYAFSLVASVAANAVIWACGHWAIGKVRARSAMERS
jgi:membrane protease YdiL (CAAX protease family)